MSPRIHVSITQAALSLDATLAAIGLPGGEAGAGNESGALVTFSGLVRGTEGAATISHIDYEHYAGMAEREIGAIVAEATARWPLDAVAVVHRVGPVATGEASVVVAVAAPHRPEAFEAARHVIDRVKAAAPIWKTRFRRDESVRRGVLVALEGIDGAGKSSQAEALAEWLRSRGQGVVVRHEPTRGPHGMRLRELMSRGRDGCPPEEEFRLFLDDRRQNVDECIDPALRRGDVVLMDRYYISSMAYQGARGLDPAMIRRANEMFAPVPDLVIIFMLPVEEALRRICARSGDGPNLFERAESLRRAQEIYQGLEGFPRLEVLDATMTFDAVQQRLRTLVADLLARHG